MNRNRLVLFILLPVLAVTLVVSYLRMPRQKKVDRLTYQAGFTSPVRPPTSSKTPAVVVDDQLRLDLLDSEPVPFKAATRNLFRHNVIDHKRPGSGSGQKAGTSAPAPVPPPPLPPTPLEIMRRALAPYTFIGLTTINGKKTGFFTKGGDVIPVRVGDRLAGRYEATALSDEFLTVTSPDTGEQVTVPLLEKQLPGIIQRRRGQPRNQGV